MARKVKMKFFTLTLHLEGMDEFQRAAKSPEHADSMIALIGSAALNNMEKEDVLSSIMTAPNRKVWGVADLSKVVAALEAAAPKRRRTTQNYVENLTRYMQPSEWAKWKENGAAGCENTATELMQRIKSIGGKNLCEYSKKRAAAIWLFLRGDARSMGNVQRAVLREQFTQKLGRSVRDFEPLEYIVTLPEPSVFEREHNQMWLRAFPVERPQQIAETDVSEVLFIDGLFHGVRVATHHIFTPPSQIQPTMNPLQMQPMMNPMEIMRFAMQHFQTMCQNSANGPDVTIYGGQPRGRPMRSLQNMPSSLPPPLLDGRSGVKLPVLDRRPEDAGAGAGSVFAGGAGSVRAGDGDAVSTPMTPRSSADSPAASPRTAPPSPKLATSDERDAVGLTLQRMLARSKLPAAAAAPAHTASKKPEKTKPLKKSCKTPLKKPAGKIVKDEKGGVAFKTPKKADRKCTKPSISWETSRNQVMCRSGFSGPGSTHKITFKEAGGAKKAYALAQAWLKKAMKVYEAHK